MNTLKIYPKKIRKVYEKNIVNSGIKIPPERYHNKIFGIAVVISLISSLPLFYFQKSILYGISIFILLNIFFFFRISLKASSRIKKIEMVFPDFISLMASNLRSGITIDEAFLISARPEFYPLDQEILKTGKEIATGKNIILAFKTMAKRIDSEKISKVIALILSGLNAGGNISDLLEETSKNMKEKEIIEKKAASTIAMYVIFIFVAVGIGAPVLFGLSSVLVEIVIDLASKMPIISTTQTNLPFTFNQISLSLSFVVYFSIAFIVMSDLIASILIGLVNKGEGKQGLKYFIPLTLVSLGIFFAIRILLSQTLLELISSF